MGRLIGVMATRADRLREVFHQERSVLTAKAAKRADGWGLGFYQGGEILHKKRPQPGGEQIDWEEIASDIRTHCAIAHVRQATVGDFRAENVHPFRMRQWLFAHNGTVDRFAAIRDSLLESMPDFLRRDVRGETDSEHVFHTILAFLHDASQLDNPDVDDRAVIHAIRSTVSLIDRMSAEVGGKPGTLNLCITNGQRMYALRRGRPLVYVEREGLDSVEQLRGPRSIDKGLRYVLLVSDGTETPADFQTVDEGTVLVVDRDVRVERVAL